MGKTFVYILFTMLAVCSCTAVCFVPETKGKEIPDTIADCLKRGGTKANKERSTGEEEEENGV